jgi:hypothetical protein
MKPEFTIILISVLIVVICFLVDRFYTVKQENYYIKRKYDLLVKIKTYEKLIGKRHHYLNSYNFQFYNLDEALLVQEYPDLKKNTYF